MGFPDLQRTTSREPATVDFRPSSGVRYHSAFNQGIGPSREVMLLIASFLASAMSSAKICVLPLLFLQRHVDQGHVAEHAPLLFVSTVFAFGAIVRIVPTFI